MIRIFKAEFQPDSVKDSVHISKIDAPHGAVPISVGFQSVGFENGRCVVWFECNPDYQMTYFRLFSVGTGFGAVDPGHTFLGTIQQGPLVWHIYHESRDK